MSHAANTRLGPCGGDAGRFNGYEPADKELLRRFVSHHDEAAFEALVRRHGPMVLGVCRRVLGNVHEAEDAFQATFLVLARRSRSVGRPEWLANWLYGVASRIAHKARVRSARREALERRAADMPTQEQILDLEWAELKTVLDEEMSALPEKLRAPLVLCYLNGKTNAEAAELLGMPGGSMSDRLTRAREALRQRLNRRGLSLTAGLLAVLLSQKVASATVPAALVQSTVKSAVAYAAKPAASAASATAAALLAKSAGIFLPGWLKLAAAAAAAVLGITLAWQPVRTTLAQAGIISTYPGSTSGSCQSVVNGSDGTTIAVTDPVASGKDKPARAVSSEQPGSANDASADAADGNNQEHEQGDRSGSR